MRGRPSNSLTEATRLVRGPAQLLGAVDRRAATLGLTTAQAWRDAAALWLAHTQAKAAALDAEPVEAGPPFRLRAAWQWLEGAGELERLRTLRLEKDALWNARHLARLPAAPTVDALMAVWRWLKDAPAEILGAYTRRGNG